MSTITLPVRIRSLDVNEVIPGLWQGSMPPKGDALRKAGFTALVLAAEEYQPAADDFPGVTVVHMPIADAAIDRETWQRVVATAVEVSQIRARGGRVLVTCQMGLNRSGLVSALSLILLDGFSPARAIARVRQARPGALFNPFFTAAIRRSRA